MIKTEKDFARSRRRAGADARRGKANAARLNVRRAPRCCEEEDSLLACRPPGEESRLTKEEIDGWLENTDSAREGARQKAIGRIPSSDVQESDD